MFKKSLSILTLVSCALLPTTQAFGAEQATVSINDYTKSTFVIEALETQGHMAKMAYKLSDSDSIKEGIAKAQAVSQELLNNSTPYGYSELSSHVTTNVIDGDQIYVVVETAFVANPSKGNDDSSMYSKAILSNKLEQLALVRSVMDNSFTF